MTELILGFLATYVLTIAAAVGIRLLFRWLELRRAQRRLRRVFARELVQLQIAIGEAILPSLILLAQRIASSAEPTTVPGSSVASSAVVAKAIAIPLTEDSGEKSPAPASEAVQRGWTWAHRDSPRNRELPCDDPARPRSYATWGPQL